MRDMLRLQLGMLLGLDRGKIGEVLSQTYNNGEFLQVGDLVTLINKKKEIQGYAFVIVTEENKGVNGVVTCDFSQGKSDCGNWKIEKFKKYYKVEAGYMDMYCVLLQYKMVNNNET